VDGNSTNPEFDPSDTAVTPVFTAAFNDYVQSELKFKNDEPYRTTGYAFIGQWDYGTAGGYPDTSDSLRRAMTQNPHMKVMLACGWYDLACPYFAMRFTMSHLGEEPKLKDNIRFRYFHAGHMMYIDTESRKELNKEVAAFIRDATGPGR
jgi:carboxypeptidase C (cathepsin A)